MDDVAGRRVDYVNLAAMSGYPAVNARHSAAEIADEEVRELIRRRGVDPFREPAAVRALIEEVLADYGERAISGSLPVLADPAAVAKQIFDAVAGLGPLQRFLEDPDVEEIWVNGPGRVFVARHGRSELTTAILTTAQITELCERMLKNTGRRLDLSTPFVDAMLPDGSRLHVAIPDITREHWAVNIRKFVVRAQSLEQLVELGSITSHAARFLEAAVAAGLNIVVAGGTQAGKTTLLTCLANTIPAAERVVSCEEVFELKLTLPDWVGMQTRQSNLEGTGEIGLRKLVTEALRMRPSRIIVGEVRQAECLDLLIALNSGLPGMCSIHANSAREAITKMCTLPLLAGENISSAFVVPTVASSVDIVVHARTLADGRRAISEVVGVSGRVEGSTIETSDIFVTRDGRLVRGEGFPPHMDRFTAVGYDIAALLSDVAPAQVRPSPVTRPHLTNGVSQWQPSIGAGQATGMAQPTGERPSIIDDSRSMAGITPARDGEDMTQSTVMTPVLASASIQPAYRQASSVREASLRQLPYPPVSTVPVSDTLSGLPGPYPPRPASAGQVTAPPAMSTVPAPSRPALPTSPPTGPWPPQSPPGHGHIDHSSTPRQITAPPSPLPHSGPSYPAPYSDQTPDQTSGEGS